MVRTSTVMAVMSMLAVSIVSATVPNDYLVPGRAQLFDGTLSGVRSAYQTFDTGIDDGDCVQCATDRQLRFFRAVAGTAMLLIRDDGSEIDNFFDLLGAFGVNYSGQYWAPYYELETDVLHFTAVRNNRNVYEIPDNAPTESQLQTIFDSAIIPQIDAILADLDAITDTPDVFKVMLAPEETQIFFRTNSDIFGAVAPDPDARFLAPLEVDRGEVYLLKSVLLFLKGKLQEQEAYDTFTAEDDPIFEKFYGQWLGIQEDFIDTYPDFLKVAPTANNPNDGKAILAQARQDLLDALALYQEGIDYIRNEADDQSDDLLYIDPSDDTAVSSLQDRMATLSDSLENDSVGIYPVQTTKTYALTSSNGNWQLELNYNLIGRFDDSDYGVFFSPNSSAPRNWEIDYAELEGTQLYLELESTDSDVWASGYLTAMLSGTTISGGTFTYWGDDNGTITSVAGSLSSILPYEEAIDLNPLYGSSTRYPDPVNPRDLLPQFDPFNYPLPQTVGAGMGNDATLGGILPNWTQDDWQIEFDLQPAGTVNIKSNTNLNYTIDGNTSEWNSAYRLFTDPQGDIDEDAEEFTGLDVAEFYLAYDPTYLYGAITFYDEIDGGYDYYIELDSPVDSIDIEFYVYSDGYVEYVVYLRDEWGWNLIYYDEGNESMISGNTVEFRVPIAELPGPLAGRYVSVETLVYPDYDLEPWWMVDGEENYTHLKIGPVGTMSGTVNFNGDATQAIYVQAYTDPYDPEDSTVARTMRIGGGAYTLEGIGVGWSGYVRAYTPVFGFDNPFELIGFDVASDALAVTQTTASVTGKNLTLAMPPVLQNNVADNGTLDPALNPVDHFAFDAVEGNNYTFTLTGAIGGTAWLALLDRNANDELDPAYDWDASSISIEWTCETSGRYYIEVEDDFGSGGSYQLKMTVLTPVTGLLGSDSPDFNGDGNTDILWSDAEGLYYVSMMYGTTRGPLKYVGGPNIEPVGCADFNADGKTDILWKRSDGTYHVSMMYGTTRGPLKYMGGPAIEPVGLGDFNNNGKTDILWRRTADNLYYVSLVYGTTRSPLKYIGGPDINPVGCADFNADGNTDILWQNNDGLSYVSMMYGTARGPLKYMGGPAIEPVKLADFNNNGKTDILWRRTADNLYYVTMVYGTTRGPLQYVGGPDIDPVGCADFNNDGNEDVLWQNTDGMCYASMMYGTTRGPLKYMGGPAIEPVGFGDFNNNGKTDILWRRISNDLHYVTMVYGTSRGPLEYIGGPAIEPVFP